MFWERSDSSIDDETLKHLRDRYISTKVARQSIKWFTDGSYDLEGFKVNTGPSGTFNRLFRVEGGSGGNVDYAARFNIHPLANTQSSHLEQWVNNEAIARGFPTPRIVHVDTSRVHSPYPFQLIEWSDGVPLRATSEAVARKVLGQLGRELAKLHAEPVVGDRYGRVGAGTLPEWDMFIFDSIGDHLEYSSEQNLITKSQMAIIADLASTQPRIELDESSLLHGDLSYDNILIDPKTEDLKSVIDWEDAVLGDPIFELAGLATFHPESRHSVFLDAYYQDRERPEDFDRRFWTYYLRIALAKAVHRHRFGYQTIVQPGFQDPNDRITLALARLKDL